MKASWLIIFFYWNGKWPWQCSGLHNALKGITMAKMQTWQKIPTLPVVLMILKTLLQMNAAGEKILILPNHRKFSFKNSFRRLWHINTKCWTKEHKSYKQAFGSEHWNATVNLFSKIEPSSPEYLAPFSITTSSQPKSRMLLSHLWLWFHGSPENKFSFVTLGVKRHYGHNKYQGLRISRLDAV